MASEPRAITSTEALKLLNAASIDNLAPEDASVLHALAVSVASRDYAAAEQLDAMTAPLAAPLAVLPPECVVHGLAMLPFTDLNAVASVCKSWRVLRASSSFLAARKAVDERVLVVAGWHDREGLSVRATYVLKKRSGRDGLEFSEAGLGDTSGHDFWHDGLIPDAPLNADAQLVVYQGKLLIVYSALHPKNKYSCYMYDVKIQRWEPMIMPSEFDDCHDGLDSICVIGAEIATICGGRWHPKGTVLLRSFRPGRNSWLPLPQPPTNIRGTLFHYQNVLYLFGGSPIDPADPIPSDELHALDLATNSWKVCARMPTPRSEVCVVELDGCLWVLGGMINCGPIEEYGPQVESYDPSTDRWTVQPSLPMGRRECFGLAATAQHGKIVVIAGNNWVLIRGGWVQLPSVPNPLRPWHEEGDSDSEGLLNGAAHFAKLASLPLW